MDSDPRVLSDATKKRRAEREVKATTVDGQTRHAKEYAVDIPVPPDNKIFRHSSQKGRLGSLIIQRWWLIVTGEKGLPVDGFEVVRSSIALDDLVLKEGKGSMSDATEFRRE